MSTNGSKTFYVAYFPCLCPIEAIDTSHPDSAAVAALWRDLGYDVRELTSAEMNMTRCYTAHTHKEASEMGVIQAMEHRRLRQMVVKS